MTSSKLRPLRLSTSGSILGDAADKAYRWAKKTTAKHMQRTNVALMQRGFIAAEEWQLSRAGARSRSRLRSIGIWYVWSLRNLILMVGPKLTEGYHAQGRGSFKFARTDLGATQHEMPSALFAECDAILRGRAQFAPWAAKAAASAEVSTSQFLFSLSNINAIPSFHIISTSKPRSAAFDILILTRAD